MWWIIGIIVVLAVWFVASQRNLVKFDEMCSNAMSQIGVQLTSRWDALTALVQFTQNYSEHEYATLQEIVKSRATIGSGSTAAEAQAQDNLITGALRQLVAVAENYPDLKANEVYMSTMSSLSELENNVRTARMVYNDTVTKYNRYIRGIPANVVASLLGFKQRDYLQEDASKADMPAMPASGLPKEQ